MRDMDVQHGESFFCGFFLKGLDATDLSQLGNLGIDRWRPLLDLTSIMSLYSYLVDQMLPLAPATTSTTTTTAQGPPPALFHSAPSPLQPHLAVFTRQQTATQSQPNPI